jgi:hypothetical protein
MFLFSRYILPLYILITGVYGHSKISYHNYKATKAFWSLLLYMSSDYSYFNQVTHP